MSLTEGEIVEDVDQVDESWWTGTGPGGKSGLFPGLCHIISFFNTMEVDIEFDFDL